MQVLYVYVSVVTLPIQSNTKLMQQLKFGFKRGINCSKYWSKVTAGQNQYLDFLIDPSFQEVKNFCIFFRRCYTKIKPER